MNSVIKIKGLCKDYKGHQALKSVDLDIREGEIWGLVGPNGSGKTTCLQAIMGLIGYEGDIEVLGQKPNHKRHKLLENLAYVADVAVLPEWIKVEQAITYMKGVHPNFNEAKARSFLDKTNIKYHSKVSSLSKGMKAQVHLALIMAVDAKILILDEPTLGLDILTRKQFYTHLLEDFYSPDKCIIITTHQIEEVENLLSNVAFINQGSIALSKSVEDLQSQYKLLALDNEKLEQATQLKPLFTNSLMGMTSMLLDLTNLSAEQVDLLPSLGKLNTASLADVFVGLAGQKSDKEELNHG